MKPIWLKRCNHCGHNNPNDSKVCNHCNTKWAFSIMESIGGDFLGGKKYSSVWACPKCNTINNRNNQTCDRCLWRM